MREMVVRRKFSALLAGVVWTGVLLTLSLTARAQDPVLRDVDVRSFLGEHLNLRIALAASTETASSAICQTVIDSDRRENVLRSSDLILTMVELRETRYLQVRSRAPYLEPVARFSLSIGCPGEPIVDRAFTVLLDPPPFTAPITLAVSTDAQTGPAAGEPPRVGKQAKAGRAKPVVPVAGTWAVREGDTLETLAKGIHPKNRSRQRQFVTALRELNPAVGALADDAPLASGSQLALPDLQTLSGILPSDVVASAKAVPAKAAPARETTKATPARAQLPATAKAAAKAAANATADASGTRAPLKQAAPPSASTAPVAAAKPFAPTLPSTATKAPAASVTPSPKSPSRGDGFRLRLSGSEMDLSRSRNVTDEQRRQLREKQLVLDSDDQVAALLSLKNTVKQLEQRLNEMQIKLAAAPAIGAGKAVSSLAPTVPPVPSTTAPPSPSLVSTPAATVGVASAPGAIAPVTTSVSPAPPPASTSASTSVPTTQNPAPSVVPDATKSAAPVIAAAPPTASEPVPVVAPPAKPAASEPSATDPLLSVMPSPLITGAIVGVLLLLFSAWFWSRRDRNRASPPPANVPEPQPASAYPSPTPPRDEELFRNDTPPAAAFDPSSPLAFAFSTVSTVGTGNPRLPANDSQSGHGDTRAGRELRSGRRTRRI